MSLISIFGQAKPLRSPSSNKFRRPNLALLAFISISLFLAIFIGIVAALNSPALVMVIGGGILGVMLFVLVDSYGLLLSLFVMTFLIQGSLLYFLGLRSATWVAVGMAILFVARVLLEMVIAPRLARERQSGGGAIYITAIFFLVIFFASLIINRIPANQLISSIKTTLPMFGVMFAFFWTRWGGGKLEVLWKLAIIVAVVQLPVALFQNLAYSSESYDSIVGTFGGNIGGGGNSAIMVLFCVTALAYSLARWERKLMSSRHMGFICVCVIGIILLSEVKAAFVWVPLAAGWVLRKRIFNNVLTVVGYTALLAVFLSGTYFVYSKLYWSGYKNERAYTVSDTLVARGGYFFDPHNIDYKTGEVSRVAALAIWSSDPQASLPRELLGYGPSASKAKGALGLGTVAVRYAPLKIDVTALAQLLWDLGMLGATAYIAFIIAGLATAWKIMRKDIATSSQAAMVDTCVPILFIMLCTVPYNNTLVEELTAQLLLMFCIGTVVKVARSGKLSLLKEKKLVDQVSASVSVPVLRSIRATSL